MDFIVALGSLAAIIFPVIIFIALVMLWRDVRRIADAVAPEEEYFDDEYDDEEYDEDDEEEYDEDEEEDEEPAEEKPKNKKGSASKKSSKKSAKSDDPDDEEYAPGEHMEDGVMDLERE